MKWHFSAPLGSHLRGVFETMIRAAKRTVSNIVGNVDITDEELYTAFTGAESLLNARPVTCQSADIKDIMLLTPNHFLFAQTGEISQSRRLSSQETLETSSRISTTLLKTMDTRMATLVISKMKMERAKRFKWRRYCISYITRYITREMTIGKSIKGIS